MIMRFECEAGLTMKTTDTIKQVEIDDAIRQTGTVINISVKFIRNTNALRSQSEK